MRVSAQVWLFSSNTEITVAGAVDRNPRREGDYIFSGLEVTESFRNYIDWSDLDKPEQEKAKDALVEAYEATRFAEEQSKRTPEERARWSKHWADSHREDVGF